MPSPIGPLVSHPFANQTIVLTTKHKKLDLIAPILEAALGVKVILHEADTDQLGTFSGEIERQLSPREAAIEKAKLGARALGVNLAIASEGSIGPDPLMPFMKSDIEYLALVDLEQGINIVEAHRSLEITAGEIVTQPGVDNLAFLTKVDFPNHKLLVTPNSDRSAFAIKGIGSQAELDSAIEISATKSSDEKVFLQSDLRSHCSPSRQQNIMTVTHKLAKRIASLCPKCETPGWGFVKHQQGLDCSECGEFVSSALEAEIFGCVKCSYEQSGEQIASSADPSTCASCNP